MSKNKSGGVQSPLSFFDYGLYLFTFLCPIFFLFNWDLNMMQGLFFVFGVFFLLGLSFFSKRQINYFNKYLGLIVIWSMAMVFIHTFKFSLTQGYTASFLNFCLLSEGFIYVLCGCLLFYLIVSFKKNFNIVYPLIAINLLNFIFAISQAMGYKWIWIKNMSQVSGLMGIAPHLIIFSAVSLPILFNYKPILSIMPVTNIILGHIYWGNSFSGIFAFLSGITLFFCLKKQYKKMFVWILILITLIFVKWDVFILKALTRIDLYIAVLNEIKQNVLLGQGFDNSMSMNMINIGKGWMYRHNDYFNIARDLGIPFLIFIVLGLRNVLKKVNIDYLWLAIIILMICSFTWTSIYFARLGSIGIVLLALKEREKYELC